MNAGPLEKAILQGREDAASGFDSRHVHWTGFVNFRRKEMHYRNGREAKNGDEIVQLESNSGKITGAGVLIRAVPGNDFCNGIMANDQSKSFVTACLCDCLHVNDVAVELSKLGLDRRPSGK